jgi:hypothetical protein
LAYLVYGAPYVPPAPPAPVWVGMRMTWTAKGTEWPLTDYSTGLCLLSQVRGLGTPKFTRYSVSSPATPGSLFRGVSVADRDVFWPVHIWNDTSSLEWMDRDRAFWSTMDPYDTGVWTVYLPDGGTRSIRLRFVDDGDHAAEVDPIGNGWDTYGINLVAEQPFWEGNPVVRSWKADTPLTFFDPTGPQIVNINSGHSLDSASITNPGDVESFPRWFIDGDTTTGTVGVNGVTVNIPFAVASGKCLVIDSDPDVIGATMYDITTAGLAMKPSARVIGVDLINPVDKTALLGEADFASVPAGSSVPLTLAVTGGGTIEVALPTRYRRAW